MNEFNQNPMTSAGGLASLGRGNDSMLVHMSPREVSGLQSLAMAHGGSLSVNPSTGLPEAGFLENILPTLLGVGSAFIPGVGPLMSAAISAGTDATMRAARGEGFDPLRTGLAGLGGYGGASLAQGLSAAGAGAGAGAAPITSGAAAPITSGAAAAPISSPTAASLGSIGTSATNPAVASLLSPAAQAGAAAPTTLANVGAGIGEIGRSGFSAYSPAGSGLGPLGTAGGKAFALDAAAAASPLIPSMFTPTPADVDMEKLSDDDTPLPEYRFNIGDPTYATEEELRRGIEHNYFGPTRGFTLAAQGGLMSLASGGEVSRYELGGTTTAPAPTTTTTAPAPTTTTTTTTPTRPAWLGAPAKNMPAGFYNIRPNLFPFYRFRSQQDYPGYGIFTPGSPALRSWQNKLGQSMIGVRNQGNVIFGRDQTSSPFGQEMLRRGSSGLNYQYPYEGGMQQYGYVPPDVTAQMYNQKMREIARSYMGTPNAFLAYYNPELTPSFASGGLASFAGGGRPGVTQQGGYLDGDGDGMSDSIPASIANKQPARLADGEFVVPADVVSHLGNGSSKAGAKQLYAMMDRVRQARTGNTQQGKQINASKFLA